MEETTEVGPFFATNRQASIAALKWTSLGKRPVPLLVHVSWLVLHGRSWEYLIYLDWGLPKGCFTVGKVSISLYEGNTLNLPYS